jgi:hypothetical protein
MLFLYIKTSINFVFEHLKLQAYYKSSWKHGFKVYSKCTCNWMIKFIQGCTYKYQPFQGQIIRRYIIMQFIYVCYFYVLAHPILLMPLSYNVKRISRIHSFIIEYTLFHILPPFHLHINNCYLHSHFRICNTLYFAWSIFTK